MYELFSLENAVHSFFADKSGAREIERVSMSKKSREKLEKDSFSRVIKKLHTRRFPFLRMLDISLMPHFSKYTILAIYVEE